MELKTNITTVTEIELTEMDLHLAITRYLKSEGVQDTNEHVVVDFYKKFQGDSDRWSAKVVLKKYSKKHPNNFFEIKGEDVLATLYRNKSKNNRD